jgi:hypothetical protein
VHAVARHEKLGFTESQRGDAINYEAGQVVEFHRRARGGFKSGERWQVAGRDGKAVLIVKDGHTKLLPFTSVNSFDAYELQEISLAVGDVVRVTKNFAVGTHGFKNNELRTVAAIDTENITMSDGRVMKRSAALHIDQGIAVTSHAHRAKRSTR